MSERSKASFAFISAGSNTAVKSTPGTLYGIVSSNPTGSIIRVDDGDMGTSPNYNGFGAPYTIALAGGTYLDFSPGIGFNTQLTVAATSNARLTVIYE